MICDRCGGEFRRSVMRKEWTGLWVCTDLARPHGCFEYRNAQDFVRSKRDKQSVTPSRPDVPIVMPTTSIKTAALEGAYSIEVDSISNISNGDSIEITLDDGVTQWVPVTEEPSGNTVTIGVPLWDSAAVGNQVQIAANTGDTFISAGDVTQDDL